MIENFVKVDSQPRTVGIGQAIRGVILEIKLHLLHGRGMRQAGKFHGRTDLKLNMGCGNNTKEGWVNCDMRRKADMMLDLRRPLPLPDNSCVMIYSEHFFEHLDHPGAADRFLEECVRVLRPGGVFSVVVPDIELVLRSTVLGGTDEYYAQQDRYNPSWCETQMEHVNHIFRQNDEHRFCYDFETLSKVLKNAGFAQIRRREFDPALDDERRLVGSLYAECKVPEIASSSLDAQSFKEGPEANRVSLART